MADRKIDDPLLVIGLGGTGSEAAYSVKKAFQQRLELAPGSDCPPRTRFLVIDTDRRQRDKHGWSSGEFIDISNNWQAIKDNLMPWEASWFDPQFLDSDGLLMGGSAGVFRQISRLFLFRKVDRLCADIRAAVEDICADPAGDKLRIYIFAGLSGGTGAGTLLDVAYLTRYLLEDELHMAREKYSLDAMLVMPDVTIEHHAPRNSSLQSLYKVNAYAALKEINFWMNDRTHHHRYTQQYSHNLTLDWTGEPFDDLILLNATALSGVRFRDPQERAMRTIAEYMVTCFSADQFGPGHGMTLEQMRDRELEQLGNIQPGNGATYRSIGAFSNAKEEAHIRDIQWNLILSKSMECMDRNTPLMDGSAPVYFLEKCITQTIGSQVGSRLRTLYEANHPIPPLFGPMMNSTMLKEMPHNAAPHGLDYEVYRTSVDQTRGDDRAMLVAEGKEALRSAFEEVVSDLERGPEHCLQLLMHPEKGLIHSMGQERENAAAALRICEELIHEYSGVDGLCSENHREIQRMNIIDRLHEAATSARFETYKRHVTDLYSATQAVGYYRAMIDALRELIAYVEQYAALLGDMCNGLRACSGAYETRVRYAMFAGGEEVYLLDNLKVEDALRAAFDASQQRKALVQRAFETMANATDAAMQRKQVQLSEQEVMRIIQDGVEAARRNCFSAIDAMTIESKWSSFGSMNGMTLQQYTQLVVMPELMRGSAPMFQARYALSQMNGNVVQSHMGIVPVNAVNVHPGIGAFMNIMNMQALFTCCNVKGSGDPNRLVWITSISGMPLTACDGLYDLHRAYREKRDMHRAVHLCMGGGGLDDPRRQDWSLLPELIDD